MRPVRVVQLLHTMAYGGVETIVLDWARAVDPQRVEIHLVCFANPGGTERAFVEAATNAGFEVHTIPWSRRKPVFQAARTLGRLLASVGTDVVHTHNLYAEIVGLIAARRHGAKVMSSLYVWSDFGWKRNVQQTVAAWLLRRFDLVTSQCRMTMAETTRRGVPAGLQALLPSGIAPMAERPDPAGRVALRAGRGVGAGETVLINVARLYPEKGQSRLLQWFKAINAVRPTTRLWVLGVGPLEAALRQETEALGLEGLVRFEGFVSHPEPLLAAADIQVHSSTAEGVPLAIGEGMRSGLPIVTTAVGGIDEIVHDGRTGFLVADGEAFVARTVELIDDAALRQRFAAAALYACETELSLARAADRLAGLYEGLAR